MNRTLIINADDLGYDLAVSRGILKCMREGVVTSATFMVNMPCSLQVAQEGLGMPLGLHFNLTRVKPVWEAFPSLYLADGLMNEAVAAQLPAEVVANEALAQLNRFEALLNQQATHIDVHKHLHRFPNVLEGVIQAAKQKHLPVRSITPEMRAFLEANSVKTNTHFFGDAGPDAAYWTVDRVKKHLFELPPSGVIEWMCHPGYAPISVKSGYHHQREVELATWLSPEVKQLLTSIKLGDFRVLS